MNEEIMQKADSGRRIFEVGILALQGDFELHALALNRLRQDSLLVKTIEDLGRIRRLIIPGGETTTINKLIDLYQMRQPLIEFGRAFPVWGTCAGMVMLSKDSGDPRVQPLGLIDIDVARNAYGRQVYSFAKTGQVDLEGKACEIEMIFIRAPKIKRIGKNVRILATLDGEPVMARCGRILITAFHPELSQSTAIHDYFLRMLPS